MQASCLRAQVRTFRSLGWCSRHIPPKQQLALPFNTLPPVRMLNAQAGEAAEDETSGAQPSTAPGYQFVQFAKRVSDKQKEIEDPESIQQEAEVAEGAAEPDAATRLQLQRLFRQLPGHASMTFAYALHSKEKLEPLVKPPLKLEEFEQIYREERHRLRTGRRFDIQRRRRKRRNYMQLNVGYKEDDDPVEATELEFGEEWRTKSMVEDCWKAAYNEQMYRKVRQDIPEREPLAIRTDRLADVVAAALRSHVADQNRPVLTHELADYDNPYMVKRSAIERVLQERCVRNQLDERVMPRVMEQQSDLLKIKTAAALPPEVLEPLAAFRGDMRWHFDARERLSQKLEGIESALNAMTQDGSTVHSVLEVLPENAPVAPDQVPGVQHPWRNHLSFESSVPTGVAGGLKFGQPLQPLEAQVRRMRYPTLQRVSHTLPADPKWRAHVARSIGVLERTKGWDYESKLKAINKMKEIYDLMKSSKEYTEGLDEKMPMNRVASHLKKKFARNVQYVKTYPKRWRQVKSWTGYRPSLTAREAVKWQKKK